MTDRIEISIGARIDELITEMQRATQSVSGSADRIADSVTKSMNQVEASSNEATAAIRRTQAEAAESASGIGNTFGNLRSFIGGMMGGLVAGIGIKAITDQVTQFADRAESLQNTAQIVGTTATAISRLHAVAEPMGIAAGAVDTGMKKLAKTLVDAQRGGEESAAAFAAVGIEAKELKGLSLEQALAKIADKFHDTEDGAGKTAAAQMLLGRSGADLIPMLNQGSQAMREQADEAEKMGAVMGEDAVAAGAALDAALDKVGLASQGLKNTMAQALAPALQFIAEAFTDGSGTAMDFGTVFKGVATIVIGAVAVIQQAWNIVSGLVRAITVSIASIIDAIVKAASMDWSGAKAALQLGDQMIREELLKTVDNAGNLAEKFKTTMGNMWGAAKPGAGAASAGAGGDGPKGQIEFGAKGGGGGGGDAAKKEAEEAKRAAREKFEYEMEQLRAQLDAVQKGSEERLAIAQQMTAKVKEQYGQESREFERAKRDEVRIEQEVAAEKIRIKDQALALAQQHAAHEIALEKGRADYMLATGQINAVQRQQIEQQAAEQLYAMQLSYLQKKLELYALEPKEVERINAEILKLKQDHELQMQGMDLQHFEASKSQWDQYFQVINDAFANSIQGMVFQGQTLREAWGNIMQSILGSLIQTGVKMVTNWITTQLGMTTATVTGASVRTAAEVTSAKTSTMANAGAAIKNIMTKAVEVFANVYNAIAGIPYVGPFLAPVMAVAAGATIVGLVGKVASAEGGWDRVPYDGARAILHKEEMVLPAPLAEGIRGMVEGGNTQRGGGITIHALDRRDVTRYFDDNSDVMVRALMQHGMNNPGGF